MFEDSSSDESDTEESEETGSPPASPCRSPLPSGASAGESRSLMSEAAGESVCPPALMILDWDQLRVRQFEVSLGDCQYLYDCTW